MDDVLTCDEYARRWLDGLTDRKPSTMAFYKQAVKAFTRSPPKGFAGEPLTAVDAGRAQRWARNNKGSVKPVISLYEAARREGVVTTNPFSGIRPYPERRETAEPPKAAMVKELVSEAEARWGMGYATLIATAAGTGLQPKELFELDWSQIDLRYPRVTVQGAGKERHVFLLEIAADSLRRLPPAKTGNVFTTKQGRRFTQRTAHYYWAPVRTACGQPDLELAELRHFYATELVTRGVAASDVAAQLGHADGGATVLSLYVPDSEKTPEAVLKRVRDHAGL